MLLICASVSTSSNVVIRQNIARDAEPSEKFLRAIIARWKLLSPTIIVQDDLLNICMTHEWVLCLKNDMKMETENLGSHIATLSRGRYQDGLIFVGNSSHENILKWFEMYAPTILRSNCPVFMPAEYTKTINLKLDSNVLFYRQETPKVYKLIDTFAVKGGLPISLHLADWNTENGFKFHKSMNRWDRRTDLKGTSFVNSAGTNSIFTQLMEDESGNVIGSKGYWQDKLFYITNGLNLNIVTKKVNNFGRLPWQQFFRLLLLQMG